MLLPFHVMLLVKYGKKQIIDTVILPFHNFLIIFFLIIALVLVCDTESDEFTRLDYASNDAACSNYTASTSEVNVDSFLSFIISDEQFYIL